MHKILAVLVVLIVLISSPAQGQTDNKYAVFVDGKETDYLGQFIDDTYFVPARILEKYFAAELKWFGVLNLLEINLEDQMFRLREDDTNLQVNQTLKTIPAPSNIDGTLWIPLEEILGPLDYGFYFSETNKALFIAKEENVLKALHFDPEEQKLTITTSLPFIYQLTETRPKEGLTLELSRVRLEEEYLESIEAVGELKEQAGGLLFSLPSVAPIKKIEEFEEDEEYRLEFHFYPRLGFAQFQETEKQLELKALGKIINYNVFTLEEPGRLVVDLLDFYNSIDLNEIGQMKISQFQENPPVVRIVVPLEEDNEYCLRQPNPDSLVIDLGLSTLVKDLRWVTEGSKKGLWINSTKKIEISKFTLFDPLRLVFDLGDCSLDKDKGALEINDGIIEKIRYSQFEEDIVRIVFDLKKDSQVEMEHWQEKDYITRISFPEKHKLVNIEFEEGIIKDKYHLDFSSPVRYSVHHLAGPERIVVDIEEAVANPEQKTWPGEGDMVKGLRLSQWTFEPYVMRIVFDLASMPIYKIVSAEESERITLEFTKNPLLGRTIVLDPGHGGFDPGAIGLSGVHEKDLVLDVGLRLKALIQKAGAKVIMSREKDEFISLWARAELANKVKADVFLSIHANSIDREKRDASRDVDPKGTETYIASGSSVSTQRLAEAVHNEVFTSMGLLDRGIKQKNYDVLTPLQMPGILLELAFLSNPIEEKLLKDPEQRQAIAEAILRGLNNYFTQIRLGER